MSWTSQETSEVGPQQDRDTPKNSPLSDDGGDHAEDDIPVIEWKPQDKLSSCEFTHVIENYASKRESGCKKPEYSTTTQDNLGNRWRLIIYVNGNGKASNHHLSLFLQVADAEDLPFGWKKAVSYVLTLEHPNQLKDSNYSKRNPDKTFKMCPKAIDWGWSQFITSDKIQQDGFIQNDTLIVRAQVTVKSSSVEIDEEDAELYLKCAVEEGDAKAVKQCLDQGASVNCQFKDDLYSPLHTACSSGSGAGRLDVLQLLIEEGADCNACNKWRETPLLIAANNGHRAAVDVLLKHNANPSLCSEAGWSALTFAAHKGYDDIVALLLHAGAPVDCLVTEDSSTPLHKACAGSKPSHLGCVKQLIDAGADVHALNKWRETPLLTAANHGQTGAVEALLAADADPCKCTDTGWSPLSIAAYKGHDEVVRLLLEEGAPTEEDDRSLSALLQAATKGLPDTVELLLSHGADPTVTTKKGDTALSILVEQNLIDAAVEMVTEYNASIPRCSRDRKKVQRARLLISLRLKQLEREGKRVRGSVSTDEEVTDEEDAAPNVAQHVENGSPGPATASGGKMKKKKSQDRSAEERAQAAEAALLRELEQEAVQAKREEAKASSKQAKKKKKKERERQQRLQEEQERRAKEEKEAKERERIKLEKEEKERNDRLKREQAEREQRELELAELEKAMAAKRKEREEREKRELAAQKNQQAERQVNCVSPTNSLPKPSSKRAKAPKVPKKPVTDPTPNRKIVSPKGSKKPIAPLGGNRRWEASSKSVSTAPPAAASVIPDESGSSADDTSRGPRPQPIHGAAHNSASKLSLPQVPRTGSTESGSAISYEKSVSSETSASMGLQHFVPGSLEHPTVAVFRLEKVSELLQICGKSKSLVNARTLKRVLYRWIVRAAHSSAAYIDPVIPSWVNIEDLVTYFHRQFISESRREGALTFMSMESLKEAGSYVATLCQVMAQQVVEYRKRIDQQLSPEWVDASIPMNVEPANGTNDVTITWSRQASTTLPALTFAMLRERYVGPPSRFLTATFVTKILYDTMNLIASETNLNYRLTATTQAALTKFVGVSRELWSDPFSVLRGNVFWGTFEHVDALFGGQKPFGKEEFGSEEALVRHGASLSTCLPIDTMVASQVVQRMLDILDKATTNGAAVSFAVVVNAECLPDQPHGLSPSSLKSLDPRLGDFRGGYVARVESLREAEHIFCPGFGTDASVISPTQSLLVFLQNGPGRTRYPVNDISAAEIVSSMSHGTAKKGTTPPPIVISVPSELQPLESPAVLQTGYFNGLDPVSPDPSRVVRSEFGAIGGSRAAAFSPASDSMARAPPRGRLFDLVDCGDEEHADDIMSGMLNSLDFGLFHASNVSSDNVDIEAISLMGIGGPPSGPMSNAGHHSAGRLP